MWFKNWTLKEINEFNNINMQKHLGISFCEIGSDFLTAKMNVNKNVMQPFGVLHGGASVVLAETVGSVASNYCLNHEKEYAVGLDINANHIKPVRSGDVYARATAIHIGRKTHVWNIEIRDESKDLVCLARLTMCILKKPLGN